MIRTLGLRGLLLAACLALTACGGDPGAEDDGVNGGEDQGTVPVDEGTPPVDDGMPDAGVDQGPELCGEEVCGDDQVCVREVCLATCGADLSGWDAALGDAIVPLANFCGTADAESTRPGEGSSDLLQLRQEPAEAGTTLSVTSVSLGAVGGLPTLLDSRDVDPRDAENNPIGVFGSLVATGGARTVYGYAESSFTPGGEIFVLEQGGDDVVLNAPGNFDATFFDAETLLVNGLGLEELSGQALYAAIFGEGGVEVRQVVNGLGEFSGSVAVTADSVIVGGFGFAWPDEDPTGGRVFVITRADLEAAMGGGDPVEIFDNSSSPSVALNVTELLDGRDPLPASSFTQPTADTLAFAVFDQVTFELLELVDFRLAGSGLAVTLEDERTLATGAIFDRVDSAGSDEGGDRVILTHPDGVLWATVLRRTD